MATNDVQTRKLTAQPNVSAPTFFSTYIPSPASGGCSETVSAPSAANSSPRRRCRYRRLPAAAAAAAAHVLVLVNRGRLAAFLSSSPCLGLPDVNLEPVPRDRRRGGRRWRGRGQEVLCRAARQTLVCFGFLRCQGKGNGNGSGKGRGLSCVCLVSCVCLMRTPNNRLREGTWLLAKRI